MREMVLALAVLAASAQGADAETRQLSDFTAISVSEGIQLEVAQGDSYRVEVQGRDTGEIVTTVQGERLNISRRGFLNFGPGPDAHVRVTLPRLEALRGESGVQITAGAIEGARLDLNLSQGAVLEASNLRIGALSVSASQGGMATLDGVCTSLNARASMGGMIEADQLECSSARANASMGGMVDVHVKQSIEANASMGGVVDVAGHPADRRTRAGMGGAIDFN